MAGCSARCVVTQFPRCVPSCPAYPAWLAYLACRVGLIQTGPTGDRTVVRDRVSHRYRDGTWEARKAGCSPIARVASPAGYVSESATACSPVDRGGHCSPASGESEAHSGRKSLPQSTSTMAQSRQSWRERCGIGVAWDNCWSRSFAAMGCRRRVWMRYERRRDTDRSFPVAR